MRAIRKAAALAILVLASGSLQGCGEEGNSDCEEFRPPAKTRTYGQNCGAFTYGTCPTVFDDCAQGVCLSTANGSACTKGCATNTDCLGAIPYCVANNQGVKVCTEGCTSHTFCDGILCCTYGPDPSNPTQCVQISCS